VPRIYAAVLIGLVLVAARAEAQTPQPTCHPVSPVRVSVTMTGGSPLEGTLLCLTGTEVVLATGGQVTTMALTQVRRIDTQRDAAWDGAVKGALLPLVMWAIACRQCDAGPMLKAVAGYAVIGAIWDSLDTNQTRIYDRRPAAAIGWRVRF
jgi:hypothetical protein